MLLLVNLDIGGAVNKVRQQRNCEGGDRKMAIFADVQLKSLTSEAIPSATQFFMRAYKISHFPGL